MEIIFLKKEQSIEYLKKSHQFQEYFDNTHPLTFTEKTNFFYKNINIYYQNIRNFNSKEKSKIIEAILKLNKNNIVNSKWIFIKLNNDFEKNWPFTIDNSIIMTSKMLSNHNIDSLSHTLAHEKIHNLQFLYPSKFGRLYNSLGFYNIPIESFSKLITYSNPDGLQTKKSSWIIKDNDSFYIPLMIYKNKNIKKKLYIINIKNNIGSIIKKVNLKCETMLQQRIPETDISQSYHPHEMLADIGSNYLVYGTTKNSKMDVFFNSFSVN